MKKAVVYENHCFLLLVNENSRLCREFKRALAM